MSLADGTNEPQVRQDVTHNAADNESCASDGYSPVEEPLQASQHNSLKHHLLGPSLTKAGQDAVDQKKVAEIIYEASKGSKFFNNEVVKDKVLTSKVDRIVKLKAQLERLDLKSDLRRADEYIASLELRRDLSQTVVHVDCDAFYAAVEELDRPELRNVPFAVGQGVLTTCNYVARKFGCRSAMAGFVAKKLCPQLICLPLNFDKYTAKAKEVRAILAEYDPRFESGSLDEAFLNITGYCSDHNMDPEAAVQQLRREVFEKCGITVSAGVAANAKVAKICSNKNKPNGQFQIPNDRTAIMSFMSTLPVRKVNGVGRVFERELDAIGIRTCGDIYPRRAYLTRLFGEKAFQFLIQTYLGMGRTEVQPAEEYERKSVGTESTFKDISGRAELRAKLRYTAEELEKDLARTGFKGRTLVLKIKLHTYEVFTRQVTPPKAVCSADDLYNHALPMLIKYEKDIPNLKVRLMGLRCTHLVSTKAYTGDFFGSRPATRQKQISHPSNEDGEWEVWPDSEFEEAVRQERQDEIDVLERLSQEHEAFEEAAGPEFHEPFGKYMYGSEKSSPVKVKDEGPKPVDQWNCPICTLPQAANDRDFNAHIDLCLSRQTIKEVVADADVKSMPELLKDVSSGPRSAGAKRKTALVSTDGRRQKRLFFTRE